MNTYKIFEEKNNYIRKKYMKIQIYFLNDYIDKFGKPIYWNEYKLIKNYNKYK